MSESSLRTRAQRMPLAERRSSLVATALDLIARDGTSTTTLQIARAAGVAEATLFRVFPDKAALFDACLEQAVDTTAATTSIHDAAANTTLDTRIAGIFDGLISHLDSTMPILHGLHGNESDERREQVHAMFERLRRAIEDVLDTDVAQGLLHGDTATLGRILFGMAMAAITPKLYAQTERIPTAELVHVFLDGSRADPSG